MTDESEPIPPKFTENNRLLKRYVRGEHGERIGVVVAYRLDTKEVGIGWSACKTKLDRFDKVKGTEIALGRAQSRRLLDKPAAGIGGILMPNHVLVTYLEMQTRAKHYFRGCVQLMSESEAKEKGLIS